MPEEKENPRMPRPSWHQYFYNIAVEVGKRSTCRRRSCGALIVKGERILTTGYNGAPAGLAHCLDRGCLREEMGVPSGERHELCRGLHAEQNALLQAALHGVKIENAVIYTTHFPCAQCAKMIINSGIAGIYFGESYPDGLSSDLIDEAGIKVVCVSDLIE